MLVRSASRVFASWYEHPYAILETVPREEGDNDDEDEDDGAAPSRYYAGGKL